MGLFSFLNKRTKQMQDDVFGLITFRPYKQLDIDYFVGEVYFKPLDKNVDFFMYAPHTGPTQAQKDFYRHIENTYASLVQKAIPFLLDALKSNNHLIEIKNFEEEFTLVCIVIPEMNDGKSTEWKLEYSTTHDALNHYTVEYTGNNATGIIVDEE